MAEDKSFEEIVVEVARIIWAHTGIERFEGQLLCECGRRLWHPQTKFGEPGAAKVREFVPTDQLAALIHHKAERIVGTLVRMGYDLPDNLAELITVAEPEDHEVPGWDEYFLGIAHAVKARAKCTRRKVGAVIVVDRRIIATGYNGAAPGEPDCLEGACPRGQHTTEEVAPLGDYDRIGSPGFCVAVHAEVNALLFATRDTKDGTAYITEPPCPGCRKALAAAGIKRVVYPDGTLTRDQLTNWNLVL